MESSIQCLHIRYLFFPFTLLHLSRFFPLSHGSTHKVLWQKCFPVMEGCGLIVYDSCNSHLTKEVKSALYTNLWLCKTLSWTFSQTVHVEEVENFFNKAFCSWWVSVVAATWKSASDQLRAERLFREFGFIWLPLNILTILSVFCHFFNYHFFYFLQCSFWPPVCKFPPPLWQVLFISKIWANYFFSKKNVHCYAIHQCVFPSKASFFFYLYSMTLPGEGSS